MLQHLLILPDGTEISSGKSGGAVMAAQLSRSVNTEGVLAPGAAVAACLQLSLLTDHPICAGDLLRLHRAEDRQLLGCFVAQEPVRSGSIVKITAYDKLILLDREISPLLQSLSWPMSLGELAAAVCDFCGLTLEYADFPCSEFTVPQPTGDGITGRQVMMWIAQAAGCFCRATPQGTVELTWYAEAPLEIAPEQLTVLGGSLRGCGRWEEGTLHCSGQVAEGVLILAPRQYVLSGGLQLETAATAPIDRVQIRQTESDVGCLYPDAPGENTLVIQGNPLLAAETAETVLPIAQQLYERFAGISYTPGTVKLPTTPALEPGQLLAVTDAAGQRHRLFLMQLDRSAAGDTVTCAGSYSRESPTVVNNKTYQTLHGRMLQLRTDVEGIRAENSDNRGKLSSLALDIEGIRGTVQSQEGQLQQLTTLEQTAQGLKLSVESLQTDGASKLKTAMGYTFDDRGLRIARSGEAMENLLDNTGMQVTRGGQPILRADHKGVEAVDVTVRNYLVVGDHARFEDYTGNRTACFWVGNRQTMTEESYERSYVNQ